MKNVGFHILHCQVLINGRHVFMGYVDMETLTKAALNEEDWLRSGDLGYVDNDDYVFITGKIKGDP